MEVYGGPWRSMEVHGGPWRSVEIYGGPWRSVEVYGGPWRSVEVYGDPWRSVEVYGGPWRSVEVRGGPRIRGLEEDWRRIGVDWSGLEWIGVDWRKIEEIGGGLEEDLCGFSLIFVDFRDFVVGAVKLAENREEQLFTFFGFLPPYIGVSGSLVPRKR